MHLLLYDQKKRLKKLRLKNRQLDILKIIPMFHPPTIPILPLTFTYLIFC